MGYRHGCQLDSLHPAIRIQKSIELRLHLACTWRIVPAAVLATLDEPVHEESQLIRQTKSLVLVSLQSGWK